MRKFILLLTLLLFFFVVNSAIAVPIDFTKLETNTTLPGSQFSAEATVNGVATFTISNVGLVSSTIFSVYFDDAANVLSGIVSANPITTGTGVVSFNGSTDAGTLPGWSNASPPFAQTADFYFTKNGAASNGIDPGESLKIDFNYSGDVLLALSNGGLRLGLHVGRIGAEALLPDGSDSDSYISTGEPPGTYTPAPPALLLLGTGLIGLVGFRRKSKG